MKDEIVEEVRGWRREHTQEHHGDLAAIVADLRAVQAASGHKVVRFAPKPAPQRVRHASPEGENA